jgi:hypothetical protein
MNADIEANTCFLLGPLERILRYRHVEVFLI